jgi:O-antigen/teichoic acid export membrane protein
VNQSDPSRPSIDKLWSKFDHNLRELFVGAFASFMLRATGAMVQFVFNVFLARLLGAKGMGLYSLALTISTLSSCMARWGIDQAMIKICAVKAEQRLWNDTKLSLVIGCRFIMLVGGLISAAVWFAAPVLATKVFNDVDLVFPIRVMSLSIVPFSLLNVIAEALRGLKKIVQSTLLQAACVPMFSCLLFGVSTLFKVTIAGALFAYLSSTIITVFIGFRVWNKAVPSDRQNTAPGSVSIRDILVLSVPMGWATVMVMIMGMADSIVLGIFGTSEEIGVYSAALRLSMLITISLLAVNSIAAPKFAALYQSQALHDLEKLSQRANIMMLLVASPLLLLYFLFPAHIMGIFGIEFRQGGPILTVLAIGQMVTMMMGSVGNLLLMTKYENVMKWINVTAALSNICLSVIFVPIWGGLGAAWANTTSLILLNILAFISVWKLLQLSPIPFLTRIQPN